MTFTWTTDEFTWMALACEAQRWKTVRHLVAVAGELRSVREDEKLPWIAVMEGMPEAIILERACTAAAPGDAPAPGYARALGPMRLEYAVHRDAAPPGRAVRTLASAPEG